MGSWGRGGEELLKISQEHIKGFLDVLGDGAEIGADGNKIVIILPTGNEMEMEVVGNPCTGDLPQVQANIDSMRVEMATENGATAGKQLHQPELFNLI